MSNIGKRFANPSEWEQPYFTQLNLKQRLSWLFINNRCDLAGVYQLHYPVDSAYLGFTVDDSFIESFLKAVNTDSKRVKKIEGRRLWLTNFVRYQQTSQKRKILSAKAPPHISIVNKLKEHDLLSDAVDSDPELFSEFTGEVVENDERPEPPLEQREYPNGRVSLDKPKGYSSSSSSSSSNSNSNSNSNSPPRESMDKELTPKPALFHSNVVKELKKIIPKRSRKDESDISLEAAVQSTFKAIENSVDNPKQLMVDRAKKIDWNIASVDDFFESLKTDKAGYPF